MLVVIMLMTILPILQVRKLKLRESERFIQGHTAEIYSDSKFRNLFHYKHLILKVLALSAGISQHSLKELVIKSMNQKTEGSFALYHQVKGQMEKELALSCEVVDNMIRSAGMN